MHRPHPRPDCTPDCGPCRWASVGIAPSATPSRHNDVAPAGAGDHNSWERGIARDPASGLPYLDRSLDTIPLHEWQHTRKDYLRELSAVQAAAGPDQAA